MELSQNLLSAKSKYLFGFILLLFISGICLAFTINESDDSFDFSRREVLLRKLGHEILLQSGDSTSRVLPVKKIGGSEYRIGFEHDFTFKPELLVGTTKRILANDPLATDYVVRILNANNSNVVYGFAVSKNKKDDIVTCVGRKQPKAGYEIDIKFKPLATDITKTGYLLGSLPFLAFVGLIFIKSVKPKRSLPDEEQIHIFTLGSALFDAENRKLNIDGNTTELTGTETRILLIFATSPNQTIERGRLQKEIWEDEGVIVGRSLDMFISKLRKKLEDDPNVNIVVVRGKGYKLKIGN